jgi:hypothetical protein
MFLSRFRFDGILPGIGWKGISMMHPALSSALATGRNARMRD